MILKDFALLASDTARSKAYLHAMIREDMLPGICIVYSDDLEKLGKEAEAYNGSTGDGKYFDPKKPLFSFLEESGIPYRTVENRDINSIQMENTIKETGPEYLIYSGYGGYILKPHLFKMGKKFIHVHAGLLPQYRGSTTAYYSFLQEKRFGASAIFLSEGIDEGEVITSDTFGVPEEKVDMDYIYEPYIRSRVLMKAMEQYLAEGKFTSRRQGTDHAETYFIIHPVLKHIAMLGMYGTNGAREESVET